VLIQLNSTITRMLLKRQEYFILEWRSAATSTFEDFFKLKTSRFRVMDQVQLAVFFINRVFADSSAHRPDNVFKFEFQMIFHSIVNLRKFRHARRRHNMLPIKYICTLQTGF